ncbi:MAG: TRIC cation channel family protein [Candidatus Nanopelagicales bacterium]
MWENFLALPSWSQLAAVVIGAVAGATHAARRGFDVIGVLGLAIATGLGGLLLRDILLQAGTSVVLLQSQYIVGASLAALAGYFFAGLISRVGNLLLVFDAFALGFLVSVGTDQAVRLALPAGSAIFIGVVTGVGGLVLRDILSGEAPQILRPGVFIAVAALAGAVVFMALQRYTQLPGSIVQLTTVAVVVLLRVGARWRDWETRPAVDYTDRIWQLWAKVGDRL